MYEPLQGRLHKHLLLNHRGNMPTYVSYGTPFDSYKGSVNWQDLALEQREDILNYAVLPEDDDFEHAEETVMNSGLRKLQYEGLMTVLSRIAIALPGGISGDPDYRKAIYAIATTDLGKELISLIEGTADYETSYRMGELEFLAQSGMKTSPLDKLIGLPNHLIVQGITELLKTSAPSLPDDAMQLNHQQVVELFKARKVAIYPSPTGAFHAASKGLIKGSTLATLTFMAAPVAGVILAFVYAWWFVIVGLVLAYLAFRYSRKTASLALMKRCLDDRAFFEEMKARQFIWLEYR